MHQNHYQENFFLLTLTTFQVPDAETSKLSVQTGPIMQRQDLFSSIQHTPAVEIQYSGPLPSEPTPGGWQMIIFFPLIFPVKLLSSTHTDFLRFRFSFMNHPL